MTHDWEVLVSNAHLHRPFFMNHSFGPKTWEQKLCELTWHCCICCNSTNGRVEYEPIKSRRSGSSYQLTRTKLETPKNKKKSEKRNWRKNSENFFFCPKPQLNKIALQLRSTTLQQLWVGDVKIEILFNCVSFPIKNFRSTIFLMFLHVGLKNQVDT